MTGNAAFLANFKECNDGHVMFGDGVGGKILGKGFINQPSLPYLQDARWKALVKNDMHWCVLMTFPGNDSSDNITSKVSAPKKFFAIVSCLKESSLKLYNW
ncbi:uncharacterized protein E5676_scaffold556G00270 [Cucumis melo var. makuwa]|uniref:Uncharacterized protein n=1 Tax=Cucumis melo var. makuwa TaxID=1194695 RepID=A0A5D3CTJ3_CUCMM|nr:uncharacterized protein E6C27_scaffold205G00630 [Cucumis melo var. makuwa]TYK13489.1 uncharacterized protein E5676_scaffold556G00270 [Cucumis melo var. makuwa]